MRVGPNKSIRFARSRTVFTLFDFKQREKDQKQESGGPVCGHVREVAANITCKPTGIGYCTDDARVLSTRSRSQDESDFASFYRFNMENSFLGLRRYALDVETFVDADVTQYG